MQRRGFRLLLLAAAALCVLAVAVLWRGDREVTPAAPGQRALPGLADKLGGLAWLRLSHGKTTVNFAAINGGWTVVEKGNYPADQDRVRKLLVGLAQLELVEPKTDKPELLARLDLDDPANGKSTLVTAQNAPARKSRNSSSDAAGPMMSGGDPGVYVRRPDSDQAWLARGSFSLAGGALSWLDRKVIDIPVMRVASVVLTAPDGGAVVVARGSPDLPFAIDGLPTDARAKDDAALAAPAGALDALMLDDVKPAAELPIPSEGVATAAFTTFDGLIIGLRLSPPETGDWLAIDVTGFGKGEADAAALSARLTHWRFAIAPDRAKLLRTTLSELLQPHGS